MPGFLLLLVPAGYAVATLLNVAGFRSRSRIEQILWGVSLSSPLALVLASVLGRYTSPAFVLGVLGALDCAGVVLFLRDSKFAKRHVSWDRDARLVCSVLAVVVLYLCLASLPLQWHGRLYEPVCSSDWEIRLPLIHAALRSGVPPQNPFFTFRGQSPTMRYYYYWYELCGLPGRLLHTSARSILVASSVYAMLVMSATLFLVLKYMAVSTVPLRRRCLWMLGFCVVLGLDVLPSLLGLAIWRVRLQPEIEWWLNDRSPGLPSAVLFGPHHVAGIACGLLALVVLTRVDVPEQVQTPRRWITDGVVAALCFAAMAGTSSFVTLFLAVACTLLFLDQLRRGDRRVPAALLLAAVLSLAVSLPFLHELTARTVRTHGASAGRHALKLQLRGYVQGQLHLYTAMRRLHLPYPSGPVRFVPRLLVVLLYLLCEMGFFAFVIALAMRRDLGGGNALPRPARALWMLAGTTAFFFLFVSSTPIQLANDLGVHAGLVLRVLGVIWAAQIVPEYLATRARHVRPDAHPWLFRAAVMCALLGVAMTVWQAVVERTYLILLDHGAMRAAVPFPDGQGLGAYYGSMYAAQAAIAKQLPADAVVQGNPLSRYGLVYRLYQQRRQAAGDVSCEGSFGGDPDLCQSFLPSILQLFGVHAHPLGAEPAVQIDPAARRPSAFAAVCSSVGLDAVVASRVDPAWYDRQSWVWQGTVLFANRDVRVIRCPAL